MAVGKTTLAKKLENQLSDVYVTYENPYPIIKLREIKHLDINTKEGFIENQRLFIEAEMNRFNNLPDGKIIYDRGPEDIEFYTLYYPIANGYDWDIEAALKEEISELRKLRSDIILYLDANEETLHKRKQNDLIRKRNSFNQNIKLYKYEKEWYKKFNTIFVDVNHKTPEQLEKWALMTLPELMI
ncbi:AAA family ATPase [Chengkuizengella sp. SCS-71B]|uniref:AAA family ATPase n=1 Tax=Chengkuizengella sp. SCS-71B TaxID=3115290 RepID=UPI0039B78684